MSNFEKSLDEKKGIPYDMVGGSKVFELADFGKYDQVEISMVYSGIDTGDGTIAIQSNTGSDTDYTWAGLTEAKSTLVIDSGDSVHTIRITTFVGNKIKLIFTPNSITAGIIESISMIGK